MLPLTFARFVCQTLVGYLPSPIPPVWFEGDQNAVEEFTSVSSWPIPLFPSKSVVPEQPIILDEGPVVGRLFLFPYCLPKIWRQ